MKAIRFAAPIPTYLWTRLLGSFSPRLFLGAHACTRYTEVETPRLPNDRWVRVRPRLAGVCGSDLAVITLEASPSTSPFSSFPFVLGHEVVGEVTEVGSTAGIERGTRVVVNPLLSCVPRGVDPPCEDCRAGRPSRCRHITGGEIPPGLLIGTTRGLGGGWGEELVAHRSQVFPVPDSVADEQAVLTEPLACAVHAIRNQPPREGERALVIGAGSIGLLTLVALRAIAPRADVTVLARHAFQAEEAMRLGAARTVEARGAYVKTLAEIAGADLLRPLIGPPVAVGGFDRIYVCVAARAAMEDALRFARSGGEVVVLGNAVRLDGIDWTPLWFKELVMRGSLCYGSHEHGGANRGAFEEALGLIADGSAPVRPLLTHTFPLSDYARAIATALDKRAGRCIKVAFRLG
jgi:threonine dehydrogenase-like Zn-dependent dehydrogenase